MALRVVCVRSIAYTEERDKLARVGRGDTLQGPAPGFTYGRSEACEGNCGAVVQDPVDAWNRDGNFDLGLGSRV